LNNTGKTKQKNTYQQQLLIAIYLVFLHPGKLIFTGACSRSSQHWRSTVLSD